MEQRNNKAIDLRKLILTGSILAEHGISQTKADPKLAETWPELLEKCQQQNLLASASSGISEWAQEAAQLLQKMVIAQDTSGTNILPAQAITLLNQYEQQHVNAQGN